MTKKERVKAAIGHKETDFIPYQLDCLSAADKKLVEHFGTVNLDAIIGNHLAMFEPSYYSIFQTEELNSNIFKDAFGAKWELKPGQDIGSVIEHPLKEASLKNYRFPDPNEIMELDMIPEFIEKNNKKFIIGALGFSLYERAWIMRGIEPVLMDFLANP